MEKLKTLIWFLRRPSLIPEAVRILARRLNREKEESRTQAELWCREKAIPQERVLEAALGDGLDPDLMPLRDLFPEIIQAAKIREEECPYPMGGEGASDLIYALSREIDARTILETGVAYGWSSLALLLALRDQPEGILISNDMPYVKMNNEDSVGCVVPEELRERWDLQRMPDRKGIPLAIRKAGGRAFDLVHYDSDKSYQGRNWAYPVMWKVVRPGGLFISDDISDNVAFKEFCDETGVEPVVIEHRGKFVGILRKPNQS